MPRNQSIDLKNLSKAEIEKLAAALQGKLGIDWSKQFTASGKRQAPNVRR